MKIDFSKTFDKQFARLTTAQKSLARDALELFSEDPFNNSLRNHPLKDEWADYRSITADADLRIHFRMMNEDRALFVAIGTHDQLYK